MEYEIWIHLMDSLLIIGNSRILLTLLSHRMFLILIFSSHASNRLCRYDLSFDEMLVLWLHC